jgi:hypothetical protein
MPVDSFNTQAQSLAETHSAIGGRRSLDLRDERHTELLAKVYELAFHVQRERKAWPIGDPDSLTALIKWFGMAIESGVSPTSSLPRAWSTAPVQYPLLAW